MKITLRQAPLETNIIDANMLIKSMEKRIDFWQHAKQDPHNIGNAMIAMLHEMISAIKEGSNK